MSEAFCLVAGAKRIVWLQRKQDSLDAARGAHIARTLSDYAATATAVLLRGPCQTLALLGALLPLPLISLLLHTITTTTDKLLGP